MTSDVNTTIAALAGNDVVAHAGELGALLHACVHDGASVGFVLPYQAADAAAFWLRQVKPGVDAGTRIVLVARRGGAVVGSVQLDYDTPPNQPHRAEVRKLLVHPDCRRQGVARVLMAELQRRAAVLGRTLLTLDTRTGDKAEPLYAALGYVTVGIIPGFCRDTVDAGRLDSTTIMYKALRPMHTELPALLIIDMQKGMASPAAGARNNPGAEGNIAALLQRWREQNATVVHVRHISRTPGSLFWPGQPGAEFQDALAPLAAAHVVEKNVTDAFINTGLERWLRVRGFGKLVIVGVSTNNSVESTARSAGNLGFDTTVVADATFAFGKVDYAGTRRTPDEVHAMALANLKGEYATIATTGEVLLGARA